MGDLCDNIGLVGVSAKHATIFHNSLPTSMVFGGAKDCCKLSILLAVPSFFNSFAASWRWGRTTAHAPYAQNGDYGNAGRGLSFAVSPSLFVKLRRL